MFASALSRFVLIFGLAAGMAFGTTGDSPDLKIVAVIMPGDRDAIVGCTEPSDQHELEQQRTILCRPGVHARFIIFNARRRSGLVTTILHVGIADAVELPFEMCPEAVSESLRLDVEQRLALVVSRGGAVVAASGNEGSLACANHTTERFPADLRGVISVGAGVRSRPEYTLRWRNGPAYFVSWNETIGSAGTSFAAARFVLWRIGIHDAGVYVE